MHLAIEHAGQTLHASAPWASILGEIVIAPVQPLADPPTALRAALNAPLGLPAPLKIPITRGKPLVIVVSDSFRYTGIEHLLPTLLDLLRQHGAHDEDIHFLVSTGTHRGPTPDETAAILGPAIYHRFAAQVLSHDAKNTPQLVHMGKTSRGTPVYVNRLLTEAATVIVTGTVVLHYFAGFGGGGKAIVPGCAGVETIAANHARNLDPHEDRLNPAVRIGVRKGNPVAEDMAEAAALCRTDLLINTVLDSQRRIAGIFAGAMNDAHAAACEFAAQMYVVPIEQRADLVIASAGNAKNFIQSHKALFNAYQAMKPGGCMIFLAPAPEGYGGNKFADWIRLGSRENIIRELRKHAEINGQTALSTIEKAPHAIFITEMAEELVSALGAEKAHSLDHALLRARQRLAHRGITSPTLWIMPQAAYTVPAPTNDPAAPAQPEG